jgi:hypothetical protein
MRKRLICYLVIFASVILLANVSKSQDKKDTPAPVTLPGGEPVVPVKETPPPVKKDEKESIVLPAGDPVVPIKPKDSVVEAPNKPKPNKNPKTAEELSTTALMPIARVKNKIDTLAMGQQTWISLDYFKVDSWRRCWIHPHALTGPKSLERVICVKRDSKGFHIVLETPDLKFDAFDIEDSDITFLPVASVVVK